MDRNEKTLIDVERLALLARLTLTEEEKKTLPAEMEEIIRFASVGSTVGAEGGTWTDRPVTPKTNVFREDVPEKGLDRETFLAGAPTRTDAYITVPRVVEEEA